MNSEKGFAEPLHLIVGVLLIISGVLYLVNFGNWGLIVASIGLLMEALKQVIK